MAINKKDYSLYGPFKLWTIENFPFIEADFDAITNYQLYSKIVEQMRKLCENQTKLQQSQNEVIDAFNNLEKYVDDYFVDLDVQEEINNKLDEMAESGQLTDIIAQYLGLAGVLAFDTISDMSDAENITNGSTCYVLGDETYNDGKGGFYKIRTITSGDTVDGFNIVALDVSNTLIAERMSNYYINEINTKIGDLDELETTNKNNLVNAINEINTNVNNIDFELSDGITLMLGDSYAEGQTAGGTINGWCYYLKDLLNIPNDKYYKFSRGGCGFIGYNNNGNTLQDLLEDNESVIIDKTKVKNIIISLGSNDLSYTKSQLETPISNCISYIRTNYPNANIKLFFQGYSNAKNSTGSSDRNNLNRCYDAYKDLLIPLKVPVYMGNCYCLRAEGNVSSDNVHPTEAGYKAIAYSMYNVLKFGQLANSKMSLLYDNTYDNIVTLTPAGAWLNSSNTLRIRVIHEKNYALFMLPNFGICNLTNPITPDNNLQINLGTCDLYNFKPIGSVALSCNGYVNDSSNVNHECNFIMYIRYDGVITLQFPVMISNIRAIAILGMPTTIVPMDLI